MKKILTLKLEDKQQDFLNIDVYDNKVIKGNSPIFSQFRLSIIGIGTLDGKEYKTAEELIKDKKINLKVSNYIYYKNTGDKEPVPWEADTFKYKVIKITK